MRPIDRLLPRLNRVKRTGFCKYMASTPTREDRCPSLAIRELDDGTLLIHDFGGDDVESILAAVGLTFADLRPEKVLQGRKPISRPFNASDLLGLVACKAGVAAIVVSDVLLGKEISEADRDSLFEAWRCLADAAEVCNAYR